MRIWIVLAAVAAGTFAGAPANADIIRLRSSREIRGWVLERNEERIVVAVINKGAAGTMTFRSIDVEAIIPEDGPSFADALKEARETIRREEEARRLEEAAALAEAAAARQAAEAAAAADGSTETEADTADAESEEKGEEAKLKLIVVEPTPAQVRSIKQLIARLGHSRANGSGYRRQAAMNGLAAFGPAAIGHLTTALSDRGNPYRRKGAAQTLGRIPAADPRLGLYYDAIPKLIKNVTDEWSWTRNDSNQALEAILGTSLGTINNQATSVSARDRKLQSKWADLWEKKKNEPIEADESSDAPSTPAPRK